MVGSSFPPVVYRELRSYLSYFVCLRIVVSNTYYVVFFVLFFFVLCPVYPMLPVSLGCPFLNASSCFINVYLPWTQLTATPTVQIEVTFAISKIELLFLCSFAYFGLILPFPLRVYGFLFLWIVILFLTLNFHILPMHFHMFLYAVDR